MSTSGNVKWFDPKKGFGFIVGPDGQDVFVHYSHIRGHGFRSLKDGEPVHYELIESEKGYQAREVLRSDADVKAHDNGDHHVDVDVDADVEVDSDRHANTRTREG